MLSRDAILLAPLIAPNFVEDKGKITNCPLLNEILDPRLIWFGWHIISKICCFIADTWQSVINTMYRVMMNVGRISLDDDEAISSGLTTFERELSNRKGPFFAGNRPGMLDYMIWPWCERADILKLFGNQHLLRREKYRKLII
ncbi:hypothetical protein NQ317_002793 [Molorchus minor]|uniref:GST C-terminal domain-containing protein n=1 Tax=Molorchus minor TaxID=1323400 RepID=A0ABQ9J8K4_9CUCU|nr:hypothetical protein NQ317_002793 [Molorchus minor]